MKIITLSEDIYLKLVRGAEQHLEDLSSGVDDGTYEDDEDNRKAIADLREALGYEPCEDVIEAEVAVSMPMFLCKDKSGRGMHYEITFDDLAKDEATEEDEFCEWLYNAEVGDDYTDFNDRTYTRIK